jgi:hypothetical protein
MLPPPRKKKSSPPPPGTRKHTVTLKDGWSGPTISAQLDGKLLLQLVAIVLMLLQIAVFAWLVSSGRWNGTMFTYWNYTGLTLFYILLVLALFIEKGLLTFIMLFVLPIFLGSTVLVSIAIVVIIQQNADVFTGGGGGNLALSLRHTGDWALHQLPPLEMAILLAVGLGDYARLVIPAEFSQMNRRVLYVLYWIISPLVPFAVYCSIYDPTMHYPTGIPTYVLWLGLVSINIALQSMWLCRFTCTEVVNVVLYRFFGKVAEPEDMEADQQQSLIPSSFSTREDPPLDNQEMVIGGDWRTDA